MQKVMTTLLIPVIFVFIFMLPPLSFSAQERRIALVIGNSNYSDARLRNSVNDATDMASVLGNLDFSVTLKTDANQKAMENAIRDFGKKLRDGGVGLSYFAGHGLQVKHSNYLIPVGAEIESEGDVKYEAVDAGLVLAKMADAGNGLNIIILDACRNNPFSRSFRSAEQGLAKMDAPTGSILSYSTAPGSIAADGIGKNGLYTSYLLKYIGMPMLKIEDMFKNVRIGVSKDSGGKQTPWESSSLMGDFYFSTKRGISVKPAFSGKNLSLPQTEVKHDGFVTISKLLNNVSFGGFQFKLGVDASDLDTIFIKKGYKRFMIVDYKRRNYEKNVGAYTKQYQFVIDKNKKVVGCVYMFEGYSLLKSFDNIKRFNEEYDEHEMNLIIAVN